MMRSRSYVATPPGATIKEQLADRGMSQKEFALRMDLSEKHVSHLINGDVILTPEVAMRLEMVLGLPAHFWNNLESIYREKLVMVQSESTMDEDLEIAKKFPVKEMVSYGWLEEKENSVEVVFALRKFFEVVRLNQLKEPLIPGIAYRRQAVSEKSEYALLAWAQKAKLEARHIETKPVDLRSLEKRIPAIRNMTMDTPEHFCPQLCEHLAECGIALVILPHMEGSFLHGATFYDKNKIVMGLTVRGKTADRFWFSLFHELAHIIYGHISNPEGTDEVNEAEADQYARDTLIPEQAFLQFVKTENISEETIRSFAYGIGIDAGIVVGRLQKDGYVRYNQFNSLKTNYRIIA